MVGRGFKYGLRSYAAQFLTTCGMVANVKKAATWTYKHTMGREEYFDHVNRGWRWNLHIEVISDVLPEVGC